jgi:hypothetical protein
MKNVEPEKKEEPFESLIRAEENAALARFRERDFEAGIRRRIRSASWTEPERPFGRIFARPGWIAVAGGILLIAVGVAVFRRPAPKSDLARSIEDILRLAPGIEALEAGFSAGGRALEATAAAPDANKLAALIVGNRNLGAARSPRRIDATSEKPREIRPLGLEEVYQILFIDKSIERVLTLVTS